MIVKVKTASDSIFSIEIAPTASVLELKTAISAHYNGETSVADQRLIFAGKVLKDDESLTIYKVTDGNTVHLVKGKKSVPAIIPAPVVAPREVEPQQAAFPSLQSFGGMPNMPANGQGMEQMMNNPMMSQMMSQMLANPQMLDQIIASNPQLGQLLTPEMRAQMATPQFRNLLSNPQMLQQMMQMQGMGGMGGLGAMGGMGGFGAGQNPLSNMFGQPAGQNAIAPQVQAPQTPAQAPEVLYQVQLQQLVEMGFYSPQENIRALQMSGGNVEGAVAFLFQ